MVRVPEGRKGLAIPPVEQISWHEAQAFIARLNKMQKEYTYRLPTEAEWEYASKAGKPQVPMNEIAEHGFYGDNSGGRTHAVGSKRANAWGLYDMLGNVWEWVQDWHDAYPRQAATDPTGPRTGSGRVVRGGSWNYNAWFLRSAFRYYRGPGFGWDFVGFRLLRVKR